MRYSHRNQPSLFEGLQARDEGMGRAYENNKEWVDAALFVVSQHAPWHREFMGEEFKSYPGIGIPKSESAWGVLTRRAKEEKIIVGTGRYAQSASAANHAHRYEIYRRPNP
jgi:hypothetical protein